MDLSEFIADYFDDADSNLNIKTLKDFDEFNWFKIIFHYFDSAFEKWYGINIWIILSA